MVHGHAEADPFVKVEKIIKGLITRLMGEASEDIEEGVCGEKDGDELFS